MSLLLKNALVYDLHSQYHKKKKNIFIKSGVIDSFEDSFPRRVIDCEGLIVTPGFFDLNSNFCDPGYEFKEDIKSGSHAASRGGFTDVNLMPCTSPVVQSKGDVEYLFSKAVGGVDLHSSAAVSENLAGENLTEMIDLSVAGAKSFSEGDNSIWNAKLLLKALQYTSDLGVPIFQNARDLHLSENAHMNEGVTSTKLGLKGDPTLSEELAIQRDLSILKYAGGKIHFTKISSARAVDLIRKAKKEGLAVTCDVSIHHLLFSENAIEEFDTVYKSLPPFRSDHDKKALVKGVRDGVIDAICSGHRPQDQESKQLEFDLADPGSISLQTFLPALKMIEGVSLETLIERVTAGPRRILGSTEIAIEEGSFAKLSILDLEREWVYDKNNNLSKSANSPFLGKNMVGKVVATINGNTISNFD